MKHINIEIQKPNKLKETLHKIHSKFEDIAFSILQKIPEKLIPHSFMEWSIRYLDKRINQLQQENVKNTWKSVQLKSAVDEISNR